MSQPVAVGMRMMAVVGVHVAAFLRIGVVGRIRSSCSRR
jgi:hypothetical protein